MSETMKKSSAVARFKSRSEELLARIPGGAAVFPAAPTAIRNGDVEHEYRQDSDFYYLTGFEEPNSVAVFVPDQPEHRFVLFVQPKDREREIWTGWRAGVEGALQDYGADAAYTIDRLDEKLPELVGRTDRLYYRFGLDPAFDARMIGYLRRFQRERQRTGFGPAAVIDPADVLHEMRLIKQDLDLSSLRQAVDISCTGHLAAMKNIRPGAYEFEVEAALRYEFGRLGCRRPGYAPIVASGPNAVVLHYTANRRRIEDGDLVLVDAGAEFEYFTGDVTRTTPASGFFSPVQAGIYEVVLKAQLDAIAAVRPGNRFNQAHDAAVSTLVRGLVGLGLLNGEPEELIREASYRKFYPHRTSHWLGMDVHDVAPYRVGDEWRVLEPGMVLTVEPGLYIAEDLEDVSPEYRGLGIRIEDDVLVTDGGNEVLSTAVPKTVEDVERFMARTTSQA